MAFKTLMVHLDLEASYQGLLRIGEDLAACFGSRIVGSVAGRLDVAVLDDGCRPDDLIARHLRPIETEMNVAEREFRAAVEGLGRVVAWRASRRDGRLSPSFVREARYADLPILGVPVVDPVARTWRVDAGDLILGAGRAVLIVPCCVDRLDVRHVVVWKKTREARRTILDALPFLKQASRVDVREIAGHDDLTASRFALQNAASVAGLLRTSEAMIANQPKD